MTTFADLGLSQNILRAVEDKGYQTPSPVQEQAIPAVLTGRDMIAAAQTGTGKTAGFTLPMMDLLCRDQRQGPRAIRALVLTPTRELAAQVQESIKTYGKYLSLKSMVVFGGVNIRPQIMELRKGVDILVATPGRLLDLCNQKACKLDQVSILVLDEGDRMLDMGFIQDIRRVVKMVSPKRQTLLFSATFSKEIRILTSEFLKNPTTIEIAPKNPAAQTVTQRAYRCDSGEKTNLTISLIKKGKWGQVLIFTRTKHGANRLSGKLNDAGIHTTAIHGNKTQAARTRSLDCFKTGKIRVLVATDIAARGLDIVQLPHVINFELPNVPEDYVHRIGRTGRAGQEGEAISLVCNDERPFFHGIEKLIGRTIDLKDEPGFAPAHWSDKAPSASTVQKAAAARKDAARQQSRGGPRRNPANARSARASATSSAQAPSRRRNRGFSGGGRGR